MTKIILVFLLLCTVVATRPALAQTFNFEFKADSVTLDKNGVKVLGGKTKVTSEEPTVVRIKRNLQFLKLWDGKLDQNVDNRLKGAVKKYEVSVGFHPKDALGFTDDRSLLADIFVQRELRTKKWSMLRQTEDEPIENLSPKITFVTEYYGPKDASPAKDLVSWTRGQETGALHPRFYFTMGALRVRFDPAPENMTGCCNYLASLHEGVARFVHEAQVADEQCSVRRFIFTVQGSDIGWRQDKSLCKTTFASGEADHQRLENGQPTFLIPLFAGDFPARIAIENNTPRFLALEHKLNFNSLFSFVGKNPGKPGAGRGKTFFEKDVVDLIDAIAPRATPLLDKIQFAPVTADDRAVFIQGKSGIFNSLSLLIERQGGRVSMCAKNFDGIQIGTTTFPPSRNVTDNSDARCPADITAMRALAEAPETIALK